MKELIGQKKNMHTNPDLLGKMMTVQRGEKLWLVALPRPDSPKIERA
jgi:hypothetical protein